MSKSLTVDFIFILFSLYFSFPFLFLLFSIFRTTRVRVYQSHWSQVDPETRGNRVEGFRIK